MTFKLTKAEVQTLEKLLAEVIATEHFDLSDKLLVVILTKFYKKLVVKLLDLKNKYSIKMDEQTELAFYQYFYDEVYIPADFTSNLIKTICDITQKKYA